MAIKLAYLKLTNAWLVGENWVLRHLNEWIYRRRYALYCRRAWDNNMGAMCYEDWRAKEGGRDET